MGVARALLRSPAFRKLYRRVRRAKVVCGAATPEDAREVARLMEPLYPPSARPEALPAAERLLAETARSGGEYRVARIGKRIVAGCQVGPLLRSAGLDGWWVLGLWVDPSMRGRGIGEALVADAIESAAGRGEERLYCHVSARNAPSLSLFRKLGFVGAPPELQEAVERRFGTAFGGEEVRALLREGPKEEGHEKPGSLR
jgi:GNAT superfamily N-acetyltransferase